MNNHYLLSAHGPDHSGIVAAVTQLLYNHQCNLEDSSMMKLGAEFGIFLIFSSQKKLNKNFDIQLAKIAKKVSLQISYKAISKKLSKFSPSQANAYRITLHGADKPGLVFKLTKHLAEVRFNITDLQTHRTHQRAQAGYVLFIEGNFPAQRQATQLEKKLETLKRSLQVTIHMDALDPIDL